MQAVEQTLNEHREIKLAQEKEAARLRKQEEAEKLAARDSSIDVTQVDDEVSPDQGQVDIDQAAVKVALNQDLPLSKTVSAKGESEAGESQPEMPFALVEAIVHDKIHQHENNVVNPTEQ